MNSEIRIESYLFFCIQHSTCVRRARTALKIVYRHGCTPVSMRLMGSASVTTGQVLFLCVSEQLQDQSSRSPFTSGLRGRRCCGSRTGHLSNVRCARDVPPGVSFSLGDPMPERSMLDDGAGAIHSLRTSTGLDHGRGRTSVPTRHTRALRQHLNDPLRRVAISIQSRDGHTGTTNSAEDGADRAAGVHYIDKAIPAELNESPQATPSCCAT